VGRSEIKDYIFELIPVNTWAQCAIRLYVVSLTLIADYRMYIDSPIWHLKEKCPCCNQGSLLELYTCSECNKLTAICDEMLTKFHDPLKISLYNITSGGHNKDCPHCKHQNSLRPSKDFEIQALGLTLKDYE